MVTKLVLSQIRLTTLQLRVRPAELLLDGACEGQTINSCQISLLNHWIKPD